MEPCRVWDTPVSPKHFPFVYPMKPTTIVWYCISLSPSDRGEDQGQPKPQAQSHGAGKLQSWVSNKSIRLESLCPGTSTWLLVVAHVVTVVFTDTQQWRSQGTTYQLPFPTTWWVENDIRLLLPLLSLFPGTTVPNSIYSVHTDFSVSVLLLSLSSPH